MDVLVHHAWYTAANFLCFTFVVRGTIRMALCGTVDDRFEGLVEIGVRVVEVAWTFESCVF